MRAALFIAAGLALAAPVPASAATKSFQTPSRNIVCLYRSTGGPGPLLRCDMHSLNDTAFTLDRRHRGKRVHVTDAVPAGRVLAYGRSLKLGPFKCTSRRTGLTCRNGHSHGFALSRARQRLF
jgi:hypothetical protein